MGLCCTEGVILRNYRVGEGDLIAICYTRVHGRISGIAKAACRPKSRFAGKLEPLSWSEIVFFSRDTSDLFSIDKVDLIQSFGQKAVNYRCLMQLQFLAELVSETTPDREPNDSLFRLLLLVLPQLTHPTTSDLAQIYFEIWYLKLAGLFPDFRTCHRCGCSLGFVQDVFVGPRFERILCFSCRGDFSKRVSCEAVRLLEGICRHNLTELSKKVPPVSAMQELKAVTEELLQNQFEKSFLSLRLIQEAI
jgi:DNA repair protein RecO (recombination protein O)